MSETSFEVVKREDVLPICPFCSRELTAVYARSKGVGLITGRNVVFFCPHCRKVLGFGQSRMV